MKTLDLTRKVNKRYQGRAYINRFVHLLNLRAPERYALSTCNLLASVEDTSTQLTCLVFNDNPFRI